MSKFKKIFKAIGSIFGGDEPKVPQVMPQVIQRDVKADQQAAEDEAAKKANASKAAIKRSRQTGASLLASGAQGVTGEAVTSSALATGKQTLGA